MSRWPRDNQAELMAFYGVPGSEVERQLVDVVPPFTMYYAGKPIRAIRFHRKAAPALTAALNEIWDKCGHEQSKVDASGASNYGGSYNPRPVRGYPLEADPKKTHWSNHAYAAAIDLNADNNGFGTGHGTMPQFVIDAFKRQGARWGGDYHGRTDPMHFEFCDAGVAAPLTFADVPQTDGDSDDQTAVVTPNASPAAQADEIQTSAENDSETRGSWLKRKWRGLTGWISGGLATGGLGYMTSPWAIVAIFGMLFAVAVAFVLFMGPGDVRAWIRKQVA